VIEDDAMKKRILWTIVILVVLFCLGYNAPAIYWNVAGGLRGEAFFAGRPTSYWRERILVDDERRNKKGSRFVGRMPMAGAGGIAASAPLTWREQVDLWREKWLRGEDSQLVKLNTEADALPVWRDLLDDGESNISSQAFAAILKHGQSADLPKLVNYAMKDESSFQNGTRNVAGMISQIHDRYGVDAGPFYYPWLSHPRLGRHATRGVAYCGESSVPAIPLLLARLDSADDADAVWALAEIGPKSLPGLASLMRKDNVYARRHATKAVATILRDSKTRLPLLRRQLMDKDAVVRFNAINGLGPIAMGWCDPQTNADFIRMLSDSESSVSTAAMGWLAKVRVREAVPALQEIVDSNAAIEIRAYAEKTIKQITFNDKK